MTINFVQRNALSPVPPFGLLAEAMLANELEKWLPQLLSRTYKQRIDTFTSLATTGVSIDVMVLPPSYGLWLCQVGIGHVNDAANYQAVSLVLVDNTSARAIVTYNAPLQTIVLAAGPTIRSVQTSGGSLSITGCAIQLLHF